MKVGIGSAISIILAEALGLDYSPSAGIITLLTIQNTKKETIQVAIKRVISFLMASIISFIMFRYLGYNPWVFGGFVLLFVALSYLLDLKDGISMNAVLMTHFLIEKRFDLPLFFNEVMILAIGMGIGIVINLIMPNNRKSIIMKQRMLENEIRGILKTMSLALKDKRVCLIQEDVSKYYDRNGFFDNTESVKTYEKDGDQLIIDFTHLDLMLEDLLLKAYENAGNTLLSDTKYLISYLEMRKHQIDVLKDISRNIMDIPVLLKQSLPLANFLEKTSKKFHELNNAIELLEDLDKLKLMYKHDKLPILREEFEYRAILYMILKELEYFLLIKRNFVLDLEKKDLKSYWTYKS